MPNPAGNYPGRQIFIGSVDGKPSFAYLVTGRSEPSKQRYASPFLEQENAIRIKPTNPGESFDPFRHYQAVKIDNNTGLLLVSNSQAPNDAVMEMFSLAPNPERYSACSNFGPPESPRLRKILAAIGPEYDNLKKRTSRIMGVIVPQDKDTIGIIAITAKPDLAIAPAFPIATNQSNNMVWVSTYNGQVDYANFDFSKLYTGETVFEPASRTADSLAEELYGMTDHIDPTYGDLRVCCVAGVRNGNGPGGWELARVNRHKVE